MTTELSERPIPVFDIRDAEGRLTAFDIPAIGRRPVKGVAEELGGERMVSEHWLVSSRPDYQICSFDLDGVRIHVEETRSVEGIYRVRAETSKPHPVLERVRGAFATLPWPRTGWQLRAAFDPDFVKSEPRSRVRRHVLLNAALVVSLVVLGLTVILKTRSGSAVSGWLAIAAAAEPLGCLVFAAHDELSRRRRNRAGVTASSADTKSGDSGVLPRSS